jgi:hypothetical protein
MRWAGQLARMGKKRNAYRILVGKPEGNRQLGRPRIILKWILDTNDEMVWTGRIWLRISRSVGLL